jgi:hypothetical protein
MRQLDKKYSRVMRWDECFERLPKGSAVMAEIGVWQGGTCSRLLAAKQDLRMILVDPWEQAKPGSSYYDSGSTNAHKPHNAAYRRCMRRIKQYADRVTVFRASSLEVAGTYYGKGLDLVFIDGDHSHEGCSADIAAWRPLIEPGGWIGGHDYGKERFGVTQAVDEAFGDDIELGGDSTWWHQCA